MRIKLPRLGKAEIIILVAVFCALVFLVWAYFFWLIWEQEQINLGPTKEARSNPWFAAQKFLQGTDIASHISYSPTAFERMRIEEQPIGEDDVIILLQGRGVINQQRFEQLWPWIEAGGTLVMSTENPWFRGKREEDALFNHLGLRTGSQDNDFFDELEVEEATEIENENEDEIEREGQIENAEPDSIEDSEADAEEKTKSIKEISEAVKAENKNRDYLERYAFYCKGKEIREIHFEDETRPLLVDFGWTNYFYHDGGINPDYALEDDYGYVFAYYKIGEGRIFVNASNRVWQNLWIACHDHAYLLRKLVGDSEKVWFIVNREAPSIVNLVWKGIPLAVIACLIAIVLMLWRALVRFGPMFPDKKIARRSFAEHIKASADFFWRNGLQEQLIEQLRRDIATIINRRNPGFDKMSSEEKILCLQRHSDLGVDVLQQVYLEPITAANKKDFVMIVNKLKMIKEQL